ncbi:MAG: cation:proton antiporter [Bacteroidota bacterium]
MLYLTTLLNITFPLENPVMIFALVLVIILLAPTLFRAIKIPEIIGLILAGVLVGPNGLNLLSEELEFSIFGTIGLLYLMFLAGLEIDIKDFKKNKEKGISYGALTFLIPFSLSYVVSYYLLDFSLLASLLISSMISTQTLVSYPIVSRLGISNSRSVNVSISGTIIADTIALLMLAVIAESAVGEINFFFWVKYIGYFVGFLFVVNWVFPRLSKWFFRNYDGYSSLEYIFVLTIVFVSAVIAEFAHIEPIIGAFFAGLALNRLIPKGSPLMNRIVFIGHTLFIPFFLISVGMLVNLKVLFQGNAILWVISVLVAVAMVSKFLSAYITQKLFKFTNNERNLIFGLTNSRAASAIAIIIVGYNMDIVHETTMNATIILVLLTCLVSSFVTERAGKNIAVAREKEDDIKSRPEERILIPISNPSTIDKLVAFALIIKDDYVDQPIYPINIVEDDVDAENKVHSYSNMLESAREHAASTDQFAEIITRVDTNVADGISRTVKELMANKVVIGWHDKTPTRDFFFGSLLSNLLRKTGKTIYVVRINSSVSLINKIHLLMPPNAEYEDGFFEWVSDICDICIHTDSQMVFWGYSGTHKWIQHYLDKQTKSFDVIYHNARCVEMLSELSDTIEEEDLLVVIKARKGTVSYSKDMKQIPEKLDQHYENNNIVVVYPEQQVKYNEAVEIQV